MVWPFENNTSASIKRLARQSLKADRRRSVFVVITIACAVCLMGILCFFYSAQRMQTLEKIRGQYQAGCVQMSYQEIERLVAAGKFEKWGCKTGDKIVRYQESNLNICFVDSGMRELMDDGKLIGNYPQTEQELCLERAFLEYYKLSVEIGETITLDLGNGEHSYILTGILEKENESRIFTVWISEAMACSDENPTLYELQFRFVGSDLSSTEQLQIDIAAFLEEMGIKEDRIFYSSNYFEMAEVYLGNGMENYILAFVSALLSAVVIYNIFYISVVGKIREYGRLKVLGATPKQLKEVIKRERNYLTMIAIPLGLFAAAAITWVLMYGYWSWKDNLRYAIVISLVTYMVILVATREPLRIVGKVSAIEAVRATAYTVQTKYHISKHLHRRLTMPRLAWMNFSRSRKKAVVTSLSLSLTGILLLCISAYANSVDVREMALSQFGDQSDYLLHYEDYYGTDFVEIQKEYPLNQILQEKLASIPGVNYITTYNLICVMIPQIKEEEPFNIRGFTREEMLSIYTEEMVIDGTIDYQNLLATDGILLCTADNTLETVYGVHYQIGDTITLSCYNGQSKTYTIQGVVKDAHIGCSSHFFILPQEELYKLYPEITDFTAYLNIHTTKDSEELRQAIFKTVTDERISISSLEDRATILGIYLQKELKKFYGILLFVFFFSVLNLANTLITNLLSRQQELAIFQSVGMGNRQLLQMLSYECLYYIGITLLVTLTVGTICSQVVCHIFNQMGIFGKIVYHFPAMQMLLFIVALLLVQAIFSSCAIYYFRKRSLVERIKSME